MIKVVIDTNVVVCANLVDEGRSASARAKSDANVLYHTYQQERQEMFWGPTNGRRMEEQFLTPHTMKNDNPFDKKLEIGGDRMPAAVRDAAVFVTDTLELCWAARQSIFEDKATPEIALAVYDRVCA